MTPDALQFRSKIGAIVVIPAIVVLLMGGGSAANAIAAGRPLLAIVFALPIALLAWITLTIRYTLTPEDLVIETGRRHVRIPLATIRSVRRTRTVLAAPALSLDRLEITHDGGIAVISPRQRQRFLAELRARCPGADVATV